MEVSPTTPSTAATGRSTPAPFEVSAEGTTTIEYYSVDVVGNAESANTATREHRRHGAGDQRRRTDGLGQRTGRRDAHRRHAVRRGGSTYYAIDGGDEVALRPAPFEVTAEGTTTIEYYSVDVVGNAESANTATVRIDDTAPVSSDDAPTEWVNGPVDVTLTSDDTLSGVEVSPTRIDGGDEVAYTEPVTISAEGTTTIEYRATDLAGNVEQWNTATVRIDKTAAVTASESASSSWAAGRPSHSRPPTRCRAWSTTMSSLDGDTSSAGTAVTVPTDAGTYTLEYYSTDNAGNVEGTKSIQFAVLERYDDSDELILWTGSWGTASITGVYDGSIHYAQFNPATMTTLFKGTGFDLISFMSSKYGLAQVSIDGGPAIDVDMYRASATLSDVSYSVRELADTTHTVEVWRVGGISIRHRPPT